MERLKGVHLMFHSRKELSRKIGFVAMGSLGNKPNQTKAYLGGC